MSAERSDVVLRHIRHLATEEETNQTDRELLRRYAFERDEVAFAALVRRHGKMVWHVCQRTVGHRQDAEDAFQATFLVLARKAGSVGWQASVAPWLYSVARRLACKVRSRVGRRPTPPGERISTDPLDEMTARELLAVLDEELAALPEEYRGPVLLCSLEGRKQEEAAGLLGTSLSTLRRRLERGKQLLHSRLTRRGLAPSAALGAVAVAVASITAAPLPADGPINHRAADLATSFLRTAVVKARVVVTAAAACLLAAVGLAAYSLRAEPADPAKDEPARPADRAERRDAVGDALPPGVLLRLGSARLRHFGSLQCAVYSPDGKLLASGGWGPEVSLWDAATGRELKRIPAEGKHLASLAFSPDGKLLAGSGGAVITLWDVESGKEVRKLEGHRGSVDGVAFAAKGDVLAAADGGGVRLWSIAGKELRTLDVPKGAQSVTFSPDGRTLAAACHDQVVRTWDVEGGKASHEFRGHGGVFMAASFSPDGKVLATSGREQTLLWDAGTGKKFGTIAGRAGKVAFAPDGKLLAVGGDGGHVSLWDPAAIKELRKLRRLPDRVRSLGFSADGKTLLAVADEVTHLIDPATGNPALALPGHQGRLTSLAYTPDGRGVVTAAWDGTVRLWDAATGKETRQFQIDRVTNIDIIDPSMLKSVAVSPDGKLLAAVRGDFSTQVWDVATGKETRSFRAGAVAFSPDGKLIACGERGNRPGEYNSGIVRIYELPDGKMLHELRGHLTDIASLTFTPDGKSLISHGMRLLGMRTGEPGESENKFVRVWDVVTGKERGAFPGWSSLGGVSLSPDGRIVAWRAGLGERAAIALVESATGGVRVNLAGHKDDTIFDVAFAPDGRTLASAGHDGTVRLWDVFSGKEVARLEGHRGWVLAVAFAPDGKTLVSGGIDTTGLVWDVARYTGRRGKPAEITPAELEACWKDLAGEAGEAGAALGKLIASPSDAVAFLRERLKPATAADGNRLTKLITDLDSDSFETREKATKALEEMDGLAAPALEKAIGGKPSAEAKKRLEKLLARLETASPTAETLRQVRAVEALEHAGTAESRRLLEKLAAGVPEARQTREAKAVLGRWKSP